MYVYVYRYMYTCVVFQQIYTNNISACVVVLVKVGTAGGFHEDLAGTAVKTVFQKSLPGCS